MKKIFGILFLLAVSLPALAQPRLSDRDQQRFDSYYTRWQQYRQVNDRGKLSAWKNACLMCMRITEFRRRRHSWRVATNGHDEVRAEARHEERQEARHEERVQWRERLSNEDRAHFDNLFMRWKEAREHRDYDDAERLQHHMREIMERNQIPHEVPVRRSCLTTRSGLSFNRVAGAF